MPKKLFILLCTLLFTSMVYGETLRSFDVEKAELIGLKLGMTKDQAKSVLEKRYKRIGDGLTVSEEEPSSQAYRNTPYSVGTARINYRIRIDDESFEIITLIFHKKTSSRSSPFILTTILYQIPPTEEKIEQLAIQAKKKYGEPSYSVDTSLVWCLTPLPKNGDTEYCANQPVLNLESNGVLIQDLRPENQPQKHDNENTPKLRTMKIDL